jgi:hypothetical protein
MALVGNSISLRRHAIDFEFFVRKFLSTLQKEAMFLSSYHISFMNYLDSMFPYDRLFTSDRNISKE